MAEHQHHGSMGGVHDSMGGVSVWPSPRDRRQRERVTERVSSRCTEVWSQNVCGSSCTHTAYVSSSESLYMSVGASSSE